MTVLAGPISLPAAPATSTWPAPWEAPFPFSTPFVYAPAFGRALVVDIVQTANTGGTPWYVETVPPPVGARADNGPRTACRYGNGSVNTTIQYALPHAGGEWWLGYSRLLPNAVGVGALGVQGVGGSWAGFRLPIDLALIQAPGCSWNTSVELMVPLRADALGDARWPTLSIPNVPGVAGGVFYDHSVFLDPGANAAGLVTNWSSQWTLAPVPSPCTTLFANDRYAGNARGNVLRATGTTMRLR